MANDLTSNPWVIDTAGGGVLYKTDIEVKHFEFGVAPVGSQAIVQDRNGKIVWVGLIDNELEVAKSGPIDWIHGINVSQLDAGGILRVFFK